MDRAYVTKRGRPKAETAALRAAFLLEAFKKDISRPAARVRTLFEEEFGCSVSHMTLTKYRQLTIKGGAVPPPREESDEDEVGEHNPTLDEIAEAKRELWAAHLEQKKTEAAGVPTRRLPRMSRYRPERGWTSRDVI